MSDPSAMNPNRSDDTLTPSPDTGFLSVAGSERRNTMLSDLQRAVVYHGRRRRHRSSARNVLAVFVLGAVGVGLISDRLSPSSPRIVDGPAVNDAPAKGETPAKGKTPAESEAPTESEAPAESKPAGLPRESQTPLHLRVPNPRIKILASSADVVRRFTYVCETDRKPLLIDDREVVAVPAAIGRPTGLIRSRDGVRLTRSVVDPPLNAAPSRGGRQSKNEVGGSL